MINRPWTACLNLSQVASEGHDGSSGRTRRMGGTVPFAEGRRTGEQPVESTDSTAALFRNCLLCMSCLHCGDWPLATAWLMRARVATMGPGDNVCTVRAGSYLPLVRRSGGAIRRQHKPVGPVGARRIPNPLKRSCARSYGEDRLSCSGARRVEEAKDEGLHETDGSPPHDHLPW